MHNPYSSYLHMPRPHIPLHVNGNRGHQHARFLDLERGRRLARLRVELEHASRRPPDADRLGHEGLDSAGDIGEAVHLNGRGGKRQQCADDMQALRGVTLTSMDEAS